mgnify:FL=1
MCLYRVCSGAADEQLADEGVVPNAQRFQFTKSPMHTPVLKGVHAALVPTHPSCVANRDAYIVSLII